MKKIVLIAMVLFAVSNVAFANLIGDSFNVRREIAMSTAVKGCVILEETETKLVFQNKCERCGALQPGKTISTPVPSGMTNKRHFRCTKCGANNEVVIRGN